MSMFLKTSISTSVQKNHGKKYYPAKDLRIETIKEYYFTCDLYIHRFKNPLGCFSSIYQYNFSLQTTSNNTIKRNTILNFQWTFAHVIFRGLSLYVSQQHNITSSWFKFPQDDSPLETYMSLFSMSQNFIISLNHLLLFEIFTPQYSHSSLLLRKVFSDKRQMKTKCCTPLRLSISGTFTLGLGAQAILQHENET